MKTRFILLALLAPVLSFSQKQISPGFRLGDASQTHLLTTLRGDRFMGTLTAWQGDTLHFTAKNDLRLRFPVSQVDGLMVFGEKTAQPADDSFGTFTIVGRDSSEIYTCTLRSIDERTVRFRPLGKGLHYLKMADVQSIRFNAGAPFGQQNFFEMESSDGQRRHCQFWNWEAGRAVLKGESGQVLEQEGPLDLNFSGPTATTSSSRALKLKGPTGLYTIVPRDSSEIIICSLKSIEKKTVRYRPLGKGMNYLRLADVQSIHFKPMPHTGQQNFFAIKTGDGPAHYNQFWGWENGRMTLRDEAGQTLILDSQLDLDYNGPTTMLNAVKPVAKINNHQMLYLSPTGFNFEKGRGAYRNTQFIHNMISYGLNNHFSISTGLNFLYPFFGMRASASLHKLVHVSIGGQWQAAPVGNSGFAWHVAASVGTPRAFLNIARVENYADFDEVPNEFEAVTLGGAVKVGKRVRLFSEFVLLDQYSPGYIRAFGGHINVYSFGFLFFNHRSSYTLGMMALGPFDSVCPSCPPSTYNATPLFGAAFGFGGRKE